VVLLALVLVPGIGSRINGASRWLRIGPLGLGFQPSELAKLSLVIFLAAFLSERMGTLGSFRKTLLPAVGAIGLVCVLILPEPDIGTTALVAAVSWVILFMAGAKLRYLLSPAPLAALVVLKVATSAYARARIEAWLDPWKHARESGYHIIQSLIAVGSGGVWGVGLGASRQKLHFLPEASTDFIFAILAEELGLVGVTVVLFLYTVFIAVGLAIARRAADTGGTLLALGITSMIALQTIINIGVVTQVLPTKGIPLPFISSGGSATIFMLIGVGILYNVAKRSAAAPALERGPVEVE
jgi:cell division protein FtsW